MEGKSVTVVDLPGIYSLSLLHGGQEIVARPSWGRPDAIIDIIDATNIERNLYLTAQLELERPIIALNFMDVEKHGDQYRRGGLSKALGCR